MNYDRFRVVWQDALDESHLLSWDGGRDSIALPAMARTYRACVSRGGLPVTTGYHATAELSWEWDALLSARSETIEEDVLLQLHGDRRPDAPSEAPYLRVDVILRAARSVDKPLPLPSTSAWKRWVAEVEAQLDPLLATRTEDRAGRPYFLSWRSEPEAICICSSDGLLALSSVQVRVWESVTLPRQWDDPSRDQDEEPDEQLVDLLGRVAQALRVFEKGVLLLVAP